MWSVESWTQARINEHWQNKLEVEGFSRPEFVVTSGNSRVFEEQEVLVEPAVFSNSCDFPMNKLIRVLVLPVLLSTGVALLPGCGGGGSGIANTPARFAGAYQGTFSGKTTQKSPQPGVPVAGTFTAISDQSGTLSGTLVQPGIGSFPLTGTIANDGTLFATATVGTSQQATLRGNVANKSGVYTITGTFTTDYGNTTVVSGTVNGTRTSTSTAIPTPGPTPVA